MSGNPFRASLVPQYPAAPPSSSNDTDSGTPQARPDRGGDAVLDSTSMPSTKTKKSVRIESPTETIPPHPGFYDADSPPHFPSLSDIDNAYLPAASAAQKTQVASSSSSQGDGVGDGSDPRQFSSRAMTDASTAYFDAPGIKKSSRGAPPNPFAKTLAHIEPQRMVGGELEEPNKDRISGGEAASKASRTTLDVESFKNMLMTGISGSPRDSGPPPPPQNALAANSISAPVLESSSTDTSSTSRQSIFESVQESHPESPHTIMAASDDEQVALMAELGSKKEKRKSLPPPAPKRRHGKPVVASRTPETVSFEGFAVTQPTATSPPAVKKSDSDTSKPLPPTPPTVSSSPYIVSQHSAYNASDSKKTETASLSDATPAAQKKVPPPVPLARRHSQLRNPTAGTRSRSNSSLTMTSQHSADFPISPSVKEEHTSTPVQKAPPPPPPTRHRGSAIPALGTSSASSSLTDVSTTGTVRRPPVTSPNPPSSRRTTVSSDPPSPKASLGRTSSVHSTRSSQRIVSNESASSAMPPPPPPPRRRQSGRTPSDNQQPPSNPSSPILETRRSSTEYKPSSPDSKRRTSVASESSLKYEYAPAAAAIDNEHPLYSPQEEESEDKVGMDQALDHSANRNSILDDMAQFQKEIEELRERYHHAA
ncbi:unnamed protein product [Periconia digitata]|uniref:Uncharacterized protein n=1 Tax=Periconia digitata TaxID=1303443 RepID=A0A9W4XNZ8_9PLEO|nr:unnamed protein product [Periconia digitata]